MPSHEWIFIGSILIRPDDFPWISQILITADFVDELAGCVFEAMCDLTAHQEPIMMHSIVSKAGDKWSNERADEIAAAILEAGKVTPTATHQIWYVQKILEASRKRDVSSFADELKENPELNPRPLHEYWENRFAEFEEMKEKIDD